jgi:SAM-dependent methyltransferase
MGHSREFPHAAPVSVCPACDGTRFSHYMRASDCHYSNEGEFSVSRCNACGLVFMDPMPTAEDLAPLYPQGYYSYRSPSLPGGWRHVLRIASGLRKRTLLPKFHSPGVMLDIGCGAGQYLLEMQHAGWKVFGLELSTEAADVGRRAGLNIAGGELTNAGFESGKFDFVRLNHSFEHIPNPAAVLQEISRILKPDGKLFIGVPNIAGLAAKVFGRYWWNFGVPVHVYNYSAGNLAMLLRRHGFRVERIRHYSDYASILGSLQIFLNRNRAPGVSDGPVFRNLLARPFAHYLARMLDFVRLGDCLEVIASKAGT